VALDISNLRRIVRALRSAFFGTQFSKGPIMLSANTANTKPGLPIRGAAGACALGCRFDRHEGDSIG
jgi:hypothetical protein